MNNIKTTGQYFTEDTRTMLMINNVKYTYVIINNIVNEELNRTQNLCHNTCISD
jgi:hypothetical protein